MQPRRQGNCLSTAVRFFTGYRIKEILQSELDDPEEIFYLELSFRLGAGARERIVREQNSADIWKGQLFVEGDVLIKKFRYA